MAQLMKWLSQIKDLYRYIITVLILNIPIIFLILLNNMKRVEFSALSWFYFICVTIGYYLLPLFILSTIFCVFLFPLRRIVIVILGATIVIFVYYLLIDSLAYQIAKFHIDLFWLEWIINDYKGLGLPTVTAVSAFLIFLGIIAIEYGIFRAARRIKKIKYLITAFIISIIATYTVSQVIHIFAYQQNDIRITSLTPHLPIYLPITSHKDAVKYGSLFPMNTLEHSTGQVQDESGSFVYPLQKLQFTQQPDKQLPNILIIFLESWRFDAMNEKITPNIYALSQKSLVSLDHFSTGNSTVCGTFGFFYGLHATYWSAVRANSTVIDNPILIDVLKDNQYNFGIYAKSNFVRHKLKDAIFRGITVHESFAGNTKREQDVDLTKQIISFLQRQKNSTHPFMAFAFYKSNHSPYEYPPQDSIFMPAGDMNLVFASDNTDPTLYLNDFRNSTHYVDAMVGDVLRELDSLDYMNNTIIIITTDHSEEFNDNRANYWGHGSNYTEYQIKVPLIFYAPDITPRLLTYPTCHIDIVPTLLQHYFGCTNDISDYSNGVNLLAQSPDERPFVIGSYVNHAFILGDDVYEIYPMYTKKYKLFDIRQKAGRPPINLLKQTLEETSHFYKPQ